MQNTSSNLSDKEDHLPEVEVLLATFNGEIYLPEFLESLCNQQGVKIHLRVSDDGSIDRTIEIIHEYKSKFESCEIYSGPHKGPSANFFSLIEKATYDFIALADQDDIWLPGHLLSSINRLAKNHEVPSMTFSTVIEFGQELMSERVWPTRFPGEDIRTILTENLARGCTIVLNSKAIELIKFHPPENAIMHDWWILLLIHSSGNVTWSTLPEVRYRIHVNNVVGKNPRFKVRLNRFFRNFRGERWAVFNQAEELLDSYNWVMCIQKRQELESFLHDVSSPLFSGRWNLILWRGRFRSNFMDDLIIRMTLVLKRERTRGLR